MQRLCLENIKRNRPKRREIIHISINLSTDQCQLVSGNSPSAPWASSSGENNPKGVRGGRRPVGEQRQALTY